MPDEILNWGTQGNNDGWQQIVAPQQTNESTQTPQTNNENNNSWNNQENNSWNQNTNYDEEVKAKYNTLVSKFWENYVTELMSRQQQIESMITNQDELNKLTKEQIVNLYKSRDDINNKLSWILPQLKEQEQIEKRWAINWFENQWIKDYLSNMSNYLDKNEFETVVKIVQDVISFMDNKWNNNWNNNPNPADLWKSLNWWIQPNNDWNKWWEVNLIEAMKSTDRNERLKYQSNFESLIKSMR